MRKIKVVWICSMSNSVIRERLKFYKWTPMAILRRLMNRMQTYDLHIWNSNGIEIFEKFEDIELHIISPHDYLSSIQEFTINNVHYHFINNIKDSFWDFINRSVFKKERTDFSRNAKQINKIVEKIAPDIVHIIGAENPEYSQSAVYIKKDIPMIVSLQTLLADPIFLKNRPWFKDKEKYRVDIESEVLKRTDYIGTKSKHFRTIIKENIATEAKFLDMSLAVGEKARTEPCKKEYDFVYFAKDISKAVDYAIEAFAIAKEKHPNITLHIVGGYDRAQMELLRRRMNELGLGNEIDFTGKLDTHDDVIKEARRANYALLPVKADLISGTIREAMINGLPVVTCITPATPTLNEKRESVLLSEKGDFGTMAENMCKLLSCPELAAKLSKNGIKTIEERYSNETFMKGWRDCYYKVLEENNKK